jgi:hypothetical protein
MLKRVVARAEASISTGYFCYGGEGGIRTPVRVFIP